MTVVVTRDVAARFRGFLASCMVEVAPGVYTAPKMTRSVRERVWAVLQEWFQEIGGGSIVMTWLDPRLPTTQGLAILGDPPKEVVAHDGLFLGRRTLTEAGPPG